MSLKHTAQQVLQLLEAGTYTAPSGARVDLSAAHQAAVAGTVLVTPADCTAWRNTPALAKGPWPQVEVRDETTQVAAQRMASEGPVFLLNFASARNPGGGFLNGAKAQEEDLCRCSGLYPALLTAWTYYEVNRAQSSLIYTDHAIYSPEVPFFKVRGRGELLEAPFTASVLTAPAPNGGPILRKDPEAGPQIEAAFARRWKNVLGIAKHFGHRRLLLGAWGCGAFGNDPEVAARTAKAALRDIAFSGAFDAVCFAIPNQGKKGRRNFEVFTEVFADGVREA